MGKRMFVQIEEISGKFPEHENFVAWQGRKLGRNLIVKQLSVLSATIF